MPEDLPLATAAAEQRRLVMNLLCPQEVERPILWFYTPMALQYADAITPAATVYDCMDELSAFKDAPAELHRLEAELLQQADVVFTGGISLDEAKRARHPNVHAFPSAVDAEHFGKARGRLPDPADQEPIGRPRLGFCGVIDERLDCELVASLARLRPDWQLIFVGPVVKIDPASLPRAANVHYLGGKTYDQLPGYMANWDIALMPFARNEATRFISPTKTPEYLAAGKPVVSTPITDVVRRWGGLRSGAYRRNADGICCRGGRCAGSSQKWSHLARRSRSRARRNLVGTHLGADGGTGRNGRKTPRRERRTRRGDCRKVKSGYDRVATDHRHSATSPARMLLSVPRYSTQRFLSSRSTVAILPSH